MNKNITKASGVKTVAAAAKKNALITEAEVKNYVENRLFELILASVSTEKWDGKPLEEDKVYHILKLGGMRIYP